jgi:hypothetical protein
LDYVTRKKLHNAFATERIKDILQQVEKMAELRRKLRRERRRAKKKKMAVARAKRRGKSL